MITKDIKFIGGIFFDDFISKDKEYLLEYFTTDIEVKFLRYYLCFGEVERFTPHTGIACKQRWLRRLEARLLKLMATHKECKKAIDIENLAKIEDGRLEGIYQCESEARKQID